MALYFEIHCLINLKADGLDNDQIILQIISITQSSNFGSFLDFRDWSSRSIMSPSASVFISVSLSLDSSNHPFDPHSIVTLQ